MFDSDMQIKGKYATYWKALCQLPGNAVDTSGNFKVFENYIHVYMVAPIIGALQGKRCKPEPGDTSKDTAGMLAEVQIKNADKLKDIYRLLILLDDSENLTIEQKIDWAFREENNPESVKKGMQLYTEYFYGGLEILYNTFVEKCITDDDYIDKIYEFVDDFRNEQQVDGLALDISALLRN